MDQSNIIVRCQNGDIEAFEELYNLYVKHSLKTARLIFGHKGLAEDIVQEAFIQCLKGIKTLKKPEAFPSWFYSILIRVGWRLSSKYPNTAAIDQYTEDNLQDKSAPGIDELVEVNETSHKVREAIIKLKAPMRTAVILYYYNNLTSKEIADILGCFLGTVKSRLRKAKILLGKELEQDFRSDDTPLVIYQKKECKSNG